jgi:TolB-like protein
MKRISAVLLSLILLTAIYSPHISWAKNKSSVAVLDFESIGAEEHLGKAVAEIIRTELVGMQEYRVVERAQINKALSKQTLQKSGLIDDESAVQLGKIIGADLIVIGSVVKIGTAYTINSRMIGVKTGEAKLGRNVTGNDLNLLTSLSQELIQNLFGGAVKSATMETIPEKRPERGTPDGRWHYDERFWLLEGSSMRYVGFSKDTVAWFARTLPEEADVSLTFSAKGRDTTDYYEMIFILYGNRSLNPDFWDDGIVINYKIEDHGTRGGGHQSWLRVGNIYRGSTLVARQLHLPFFRQNMPHTARIIYKNKRLSFFIDDIPIHRDVLIPLRKAPGYLGVASYWENRHEFTVSNVRIR